MKFRDVRKISLLKQGVFMKRIIIVIVLVVALLFVVKEDHSKTKEIQIEKKMMIGDLF